jgi:hypothetical protein
MDKTAEITWFAGIAFVWAVVFVGSAVDFALWMDGKHTISQILRERPAFFWVPAILAVAWIVVLGLHLYIFTGER